MFITYVDDSGETRTWDFDPEDVYASKAQMIEKRYGQPWEQWLNDLRRGSAQARQVLLWHLLGLEHPTLKFEDTPQIRMRQLKVEMSSRELDDILTRLDRVKMPDDEREQVRAALEIERTEALVREGQLVEGELVLPTEEPVPKANRSRRGGSSTG